MKCQTGAKKRDPQHGVRFGNKTGGGETPQRRFRLHEECAQLKLQPFSFGLLTACRAEQI